MTFQDIAQQRGLSTAKLDELTWDVEPCPYQRLKLPSAPELQGLLKVMNRRGLEPNLVGYLFDQFPDRPLERALLAYDVVNASLLGRDDTVLLERITKALAPIKHVAQVTAAVPRDRIGDLAEAARPTTSDESLLDDLASPTPSLAALMELTKVRKSLDEEPGIVEGIFAHVKRLELAHLPSLAIAFLQILWDRFAHAQALELLIELAIDHDMMDAIPQLTGEDDRSMQQQTYLLVRASCANFNPVTGQRILDAVPSAIRQAPYAPLILARVELMLLQNKRLDDAAIALVEKLVPPGLPWRYGNFVKDAVGIQQYPQNAAMHVDSFITTFGNSPYLWAQAADHMEVRPELLKLLSRELRYGSHEPHVWRAVTIFASDNEELGTELDQRIATQLTLALGHGPPN